MLTQPSGALPPSPDPVRPYYMPAWKRELTCVKEALGAHHSSGQSQHGQHHHTMAEASASVQAAVCTAVKRRLMADAGVRLGVLLSGGVDSSVVAAAMVHALGKEEAKESLHAFTVTFQSPGGLDSPDLVAAREVVAALGLKNHHVVRFTEEEGLAALPDALDALASSDAVCVRAGVPLLLLCREVAAQ